jgi:hypothetical protein
MRKLSDTATQRNPQPNKPKKAIIKPNGGPVPEDLAEPSAPIPQPSVFSLDKFRTKHADAIANVGTLPSALPHHSIADAKDFVRLHSDEVNYWSPELCFVDVPILGQKRDTMHLIAEDLALNYLDSGRLKRFRLALASKPHNAFFLAHIPSRNLDNGYNESCVAGCALAKTLWVTLTSRKPQGVEAYKIDYARDQDAFPSRPGQRNPSPS